MLFITRQKMETAHFRQRRSRRAFCLLYLFMMYRLFICWVWMGIVLSLRAGSVDLDSMTVGSTTYSNVTVFGANATDLFFASDQGVSNVKLKFLSPELQQKFNYNSNAAAKVEQQQIDSEKHYQENLAALIAAKAKAARDDREAQIQATYSQAGLADAVSDASPIGRQAPDLDFTNWVGVKPDLTGKFTIISVWSPKSASCRKWIPALNDLHKTLAGKVEVVGVTTATNAEVSESEPKTDFPSALDPEGKFLTEAGITMLPCVLLVDTNNVVRYLGHPAAVTTNTLQGLFNNTEE
jgi:thiol-disulfide isomerase/thioredoxin